MIGYKIKSKIEENGMSINDFALKIGMRRESVYKIFEKDDLNTSVIKKASRILNVPITYFFDDEEKGNNTLVNGNNNTVASGHHSQITILENDIHSKEVEIEHLKQIIEEKERLIQVLMKNTNK